jgi:hypothetical protein
LNTNLRRDEQFVNNCILQRTEKEYVNLKLHNKLFSFRKICVACKRALHNGKFPQFATLEKIICNTLLSVVNTFPKHEDRLMSMRIETAQIKLWVINYHK